MKLVYVYLGEELPRYVTANLQRNLKLFDNLDQVLIVDNSEVQKKATKAGIQTSFYSRTTSTARVLNKSSLNQSFRKNFWIHSIERLFAVLDYKDALHDESILHSEADILLMPNFPFEKIEKQSQVRWMPFNDSHDVASLMYLPRQFNLADFRNRIIESIEKNSGLTDMTLLSEISRNSNIKVSMFPVAESPGSTLFSKDVQDMDRNKIGFGNREFQGFFDSAPIGMWLLGQDPRNHRGKLLRYIDLKESFIQVGSNSIDWNQRENLLLEIGEKKYSLFNLHVHSKELKYFDSNWELSIARAVKDAKTRKNGSKLLIKVFLSCAFSALIKRVRSL